MKKFINQQDMKELNSADIFSLVRSQGTITRKQISEQLEISWGAVSTITSLLIEEGYLEEKKATSDGAAGRTPSFLEVNTGVHFSIGIDINTEKLRAVLMNLKHEIVSFWESKPDFSSEESLVASLFSFIERILRDTGKLHILCIGIAMQGVVDAQNGISIEIPGKKNWNNVHLSEIVEEKFNIPTFIDHDPNCILLAASHNQNSGDALLIRADHGIGMAAMIGGKIIDKPGIFEISHTVVEIGGIPCSCGRRGCLGKYATINALSSRYGKSFEELISDLEGGSAHASQILSTAVEYLAFAISNVACLLNAEQIILCGSLWNHRNLFWNDFLEKFKTFSNRGDIQFSFTGVSSAPLGAALVAERSVLRRIALNK